MRVKIKDVAKLAGVSSAAVSAVLNNKVGKSIRVSTENQDKILAAASKLGYVPNPAAQNLVSGHSQIISVFSYESVFPFSAENEFYSFLLGIEKSAEKNGYDILLLTKTSKANTDQSYFSRLKLGDGGILLGIKKHTEILLRLIDDNFPLVFIGRREIEDRSVNIVNFDYDSIIRRLVALTRSKGHKKSIYLKKRSTSEPYVDRQNGLNKAISEFSDFKCTSCYTEEGFDKTELRKLIDSGISLIIIERKSIAIQVEQLCKESDIKLGRDISAVLLEDKWFSSEINWTCWSNVRAEIGMMAVDLLNDIILKKVKTPATRMIEPEVVAGETLGSPGPDGGSLTLS